MNLGNLVIETMRGCEQGDIDALLRWNDLCRSRIEMLRIPNSNNDTIKDGIVGDLEWLAEQVKKVKT